MGKFISLEGGDGSGKTTILKEVSKELKKKNIDFIITREPGGVDISEQIRKIVLGRKNKNLDMKTEALLFAAARRQHLVEKIIPALNSGKMVIVDRFIYSSIVYQGYARGIGIDKVRSINEFAIDDYYPDKNIYIDVAPEIALKRINSTREINRLDLEKIEFHKKVREGYLKLVEKENNFVLIDGKKTIKEVVKAVLGEIYEL